MRNEWNHRQQQQQQGFCKELQQYLWNALHWTTSKAIALKVYRYKICMEIFSKPFNNLIVLQIGCSFMYIVVTLSHNPEGYWVPHRRCPCTSVRLCLISRQMAKAREECQQPGLLLGNASISCYLDKIYRRFWLWSHLPGLGSTWRGQMCCYLCHLWASASFNLSTSAQKQVPCCNTSTQGDMGMNKIGMSDFCLCGGHW